MESVAASKCDGIRYQCGFLLELLLGDILDLLFGDILDLLVLLLLPLLGTGEPAT